MTDSSHTSDLQEAFEEKERLESSASLHLFQWAIVLASLVLTLGAWGFTKTQHEAQIRERFDSEATQIMELVTDRMLQYESVLSSGAAAIEANYVHTDHIAWRKYAQSLDVQKKYPGINGIGFIDHADRNDLESYLEKQREDRTDFNIYPAHSEAELFPVTFIEPIQANAPALGLDMAHETNRYTAAKKARETGKPQITGPITLVQDAQKTPGFLMFSPVYMRASLDTADDHQSEFLGLVYAPFIVDNLMRGTLRNERRQVGLTISDTSTALFDENHASITDFDPTPKFKSQKTINIYGRNWTLDIWSKMSFNRAAANNKPRMILIGGLAIDALLLSLFALLAQGNQRALNFAREMADAQKADAARLNNIIENTVDGMMTSGREERVESFNKACETIFGYSAEEIIGKKIDVIFPYPREGAYPELEKDGLIKNLKVMGRRKDGADVPLEVSSNEIIVKGRTLYNIIVRDITAREEADAKLKEIMDDLILSNEELEKFAYIASHDLKSPLRGIDNLSKWLAEDLDAVLDDENRERIATLRGRVSRMDILLNDLLEYSRSGYSDRDTNTVNASKLVREVWDILHVPEGFNIIVDERLGEIEVARMPLEQILHNLINNALKHHDKQSGLIKVSCRSKGQFYEFTISDDGPGIPSEFHEKVFEMFQTLRPRDDVEGSGMGLALVKKTVYCYGGKINMTSEPGKGCSFTFTLPKVLRTRIRARRSDQQKAA